MMLPNNEMVVGSEDLNMQVKKVATKGKFRQNSEM